MEQLVLEVGHECSNHVVVMCTGNVRPRNQVWRLGGEVAKCACGRCCMARRHNQCWGGGVGGVEGGVVGSWGGWGREEGREPPVAG